MNILRFSLRSLKRDWRSGELQMIFFATFIAVAAITTVGFFTDRVHRLTELQATELLAADLVIRSANPVPQEIIDAARQNNLVTTRTVNFRSVVVAGENLQLAEAKAIEKGYPIRGKLRITDTLFGNEYITEKLPEPGTIWVDPRLFQILGLNIGDSVTLGESSFTVTHILTYEPDRGGDLFNIAPRVLMNLADLEATGLILPARRARFKLLLGGDVNAIENFRELPLIKNHEEIRLQDIRDARPELKTALDRSQQFLGLAVLISIALAGLAISMSAQRYVIRHFDHCAIMRCLGTDQKNILRVYFYQLLFIALIATVAGNGAGYLAQGGLAMLITGFTTAPLPAAGFFPVLQGTLTALISVIGFATPQLLRLKNVSPLRVLRRDMTPLPASALSTYGLAVIALALLTPWQSGNIKLTLNTLFGILMTALLLVAGARILIHFINRMRSQVGIAARYGLANIARRPGQSTIQILGIGLGVMVMLLLTLVRTDLLDNWRERLPDDAPNYFLINIQPSEVMQLKNWIKESFNLETELYPMIRGRLTAINGKPVDPESYSEDRARRLATREFNLSQSEIMQADNRLLKGEWWDKQETRALFSVEEGIAESLGIKINDMLTYRIAGEEITGQVSNLRWVEWDSFHVNFFVLANPGTLDNFPATYITSFHIPQDKKQGLSELVRTFPSVTVIDVDAILTQVRRIMDQVTKTIEFVFGFTLIAGIIVLAAALQTTHDERIRESALLFAMGASRDQIMMSLFAEFACLGLIAGLLSAFMATVAELLLAEFVFQMDIIINPWIWIFGPLICTLIIVIAGLLGTRRVYRSPPLLTLRQA